MATLAALAGPAMASCATPRDAYVEEGAVKLTDDRSMVCATWETLRDGREACFAVLRKDDGLRVYDTNGEPAATARFEHGDVERLAG